MSTPQPRPAARQPLGELLIRAGHLTEDQLRLGLEEQKAFGGRLGRHLIELGFIDDATLLDTLARQLSLPFVNLDAPGVVGTEVARYARADLCEQWGFCPVSFDPSRGVLIIAVSDPDLQLVRDLETLLDVKLEIRLAPADAIERRVARLYHGHEDQPVRQMQGLQLARSAQKEARGAAGYASLDALGPPGAPQGPPTGSMPAPAIPGALNPFDAQIAQQVAMQQQLQQHLQQQIHMQQMQQLQMHTAQQVAPSMPLSPAVGFPPQGYPPQVPPVAYEPPAARPTPSPMPDAPARPARSRRSMPLLPEPETPSVEALQARVEKLEKALAEQTERLETTLVAQARALRSLVDVLVDRNLISKAEMVEKQKKLATPQ